MNIITHFETEHYNERQPGGARPRFLVIHGTEVDEDESVKILRGQTDHEVSCHYMITTDGRIFNFVDEQHRAWHAGKSCWADETDINSHSIGIELVAVSPRGLFENVIYSGPQMNALIALAHDICTRHSIDPWYVVGHQDIAPERKHDPGPRFPWRLLAENNIGIWPPMPPVMDRTPLDADEEQAFFASLWGYGYDAGFMDDNKKQAVIRAFRCHFIPEFIFDMDPPPLCQADLSVAIMLNEIKKNKFL